jgi:small subunit ribosomal protein S21
LHTLLTPLCGGIRFRASEKTPETSSFNKQATPYESYSQELTPFIGPSRLGCTGQTGNNFQTKELPMPEVIVRKGEPVDRALKRLKNKLDAEGILEEVRRLRAFETPNQKSRRKAKANAKRGRTKFRFNPS